MIYIFIPYFTLPYLTYTMGSVGQQELPVRTKSGGVFGKAMNKEFPFDPEWTNLNHGEF